MGVPGLGNTLNPWKGQKLVSRKWESIDYQTPPIIIFWYTSPSPSPSLTPQGHIPTCLRLGESQVNGINTVLDNILAVVWWVLDRLTDSEPQKVVGQKLKIEVTRTSEENKCASLEFTTAVGFNEFENDLDRIPNPNPWPMTFCCADAAGQAGSECLLHYGMLLTVGLWPKSQ